MDTFHAVKATQILAMKMDLYGLQSAKKYQGNYILTTFLSNKKNKIERKRGVSDHLQISLTILSESEQIN